MIDAKLGCLWHINLCLESLCSYISDLSICTQFLLKRNNAEQILLKVKYSNIVYTRLFIFTVQVLLENIKKDKPNLTKIRESFNHMNMVYRNWLEIDLQSQTASPANAPIPQKSDNTATFFVDQNSMYCNVFQELDDDENLLKLERVLICYITSLSEYGIPTQYNINEMLVTTLVSK